MDVCTSRLNQGLACTIAMPNDAFWQCVGISFRLERKKILQINNPPQRNVPFRYFLLTAVISFFHHSMASKRRMRE